MKLLIFCITLCCLASPSVAQNSPHSIGLGVHYWQVLDDLDEAGFDESGLAYIGAYRYDGGLIALHAELEVFPEEFGAAAEEVYAPQVVAILGDGIYAGIGAGILYSDGEFADTPYFLLRAGLNIIAIGPLSLDLNANYIFTDFDNLSTSDIDSNTITLGAMARINF